MKLGILVVGIVAALAVGGGVGYRLWANHGLAQAADPAATNDPAVRVAAATVARKTLRRVTVQPGEIQAFEQTPLFVKLPGFVQTLHCDIGDHLGQGQAVADIRIPELQDEQRQKAAAVVHAKAGVPQATSAVRAAEKAVDTAEANLREARAGTIRARPIRLAQVGIRANLGIGRQPQHRPPHGRRNPQCLERRGRCSRRGGGQGRFDRGDVGPGAKRTWKRPRPTWPLPRPRLASPRPIWPEWSRC